MEVPVGSTAAVRGLRGGDVILACNGQRVRTLEDLLTLLERSGVGKVVLEVQRAQAPVSLEVAVGSDRD